MQLQIAAARPPINLCCPYAVIDHPRRWSRDDAALAAAPRHAAPAAPRHPADRFQHLAASMIASPQAVNRIRRRN